MNSPADDSGKLGLVAEGLSFPTSLTFDEASVAYVAESGLPFGGAPPGGRTWQLANRGDYARPRSRGDKTRRRRPYQAFMLTQYSTNLTVVVWQRLGGSEAASYHTLSLHALVCLNAAARPLDTSTTYAYGI